MTPDEQNKRIAEWCGFKDGHYKCEGCGFAVKWDDDSVTSGGHHGGDGCGAKLLMPPNYHQDLNAMHEAEKKLSDAKYPSYVSNLTGLYLEITKGHSMLGAFSATATQRAESPLRTIGRWED